MAPKGNRPGKVVTQDDPFSLFNVRVQAISFGNGVFGDRTEPAIAFRRPVRCTADRYAKVKN